jgi:hypothetical protein
MTDEVPRLWRDEIEQVQRLLLIQVFKDVYHLLGHSPVDEMVVYSSLAKPVARLGLVEEMVRLRV